VIGGVVCYMVSPVEAGGWHRGVSPQLIKAFTRVSPLIVGLVISFYCY